MKCNKIIMQSNKIKIKYRITKCKDSNDIQSSKANDSQSRR